jgi:hypothetical protein
MKDEIKKLEKMRAEICHKIAALGDMRKGSVSRVQRPCNKAACVCRKGGHPGHGPYYYWTFKDGGKTVTRQFPEGEESRKIITEIENYKEFRALVKRMIEVNEKLCELRGV